VSDVLTIAAEAILQLLAVGAFLGAMFLIALWALERGPLRRFNRTTIDDLPPIRYSRESPVELYLRRERERRTEWQEVDR